jgi:hypothetical protein
MARKRHTKTRAETVLGDVIRVLEQDDSALDGDERAQRDVLFAYRGALLDVLAYGPLFCEDALLRATDDEKSFDVLNLRARFLQLLRSAVRLGEIGRPSTDISLYRHVTFKAQLVDGLAHITADAGQVDDLIVLQLILLLQTVGLKNVRLCSAPDCPHPDRPSRRLYVKTYRREFCSVQCQKRVYARAKRQQDRERKERRARQRRKA